MLRDDFSWLVPAILIAIYQAFWVWRRLPEYQGEDTEISGDYTPEDLLKFNFLKYVVYCFFIFQLVFPILPISRDGLITIFIRIFGYLLIVTGLTLSLRALKVLGNNWSGMFVYRIKKGQKLVTHGVYGLVRHPIYLAVILETTGFELVANSWLFVPVFVTSFLLCYYHIRGEEILLEKYFDKEWRIYKSLTKMIIPYLI